MVHGLDGQQDRELLPRLIFWNREPQLELARRLDHVFDDLIDRVLIDSGPFGDDATGRTADAAEELRGGDVAGELGRIGEEAPQIAVVEVRVIDTVVAP